MFTYFEQAVFNKEINISVFYLTKEKTAKYFSDFMCSMYSKLLLGCTSLGSIQTGGNKEISVRVRYFR